jgi:hypothetical protein
MPNRIQGQKMMSKKALAAFGTMAIVFSSSNLAEAAPRPKSGSKCLKLGLIEEVNGKKFTCIKSGRKLVWNKGEKVVTPEPRPTPSSTTPTSSPTQSKKLNLEASLDSDSILRLQLTEGVGLIECASFLTYPWGVADSYEGVFYRQSNEYLIPINSLSKDELPNSFTFHCNDYAVQSYAIEWIKSENQIRPKVSPMSKAINPTSVKNKLPDTKESAKFEGIRIFGLENPEEVAKTMFQNAEGRILTQTSIIYVSPYSKDFCTSSIFNLEGKQVKLSPYNPHQRNVPSDKIVRSEYDRLNSFGYAAFRGSNQETLRLVVSCLAAGEKSQTFVHPGPLNPYIVARGGPCPSEVKGRTLAGYPKSRESNFICLANSSGSNTWSQIDPNKPASAPKP